MKSILLALLLFFTLSQVHADKCKFVGNYDLSGWEAGDNFAKAPTYTGTIIITEAYGTYRFEGSADGMVFFGKGLTNDCKTIAFSFSSADKQQIGVTLATKTGNDFNVSWTYNLPDNSGAGKEIWKKRN